jgi:hypothetical protein
VKSYPFTIKGDGFYIYEVTKRDEMGIDRDESVDVARRRDADALRPR